MIQVKNLTKRFGETLAVSGISFGVKRGEIVGFLGPNGAGKSTTMRMLSGYYVPDEGTAEICGYDIVENGLQARSQIGYLPESTPLYYDMNVMESLEFAAKIHGFKGFHIGNKVKKIVDTCGLGSVLKKKIYQLSKGYKQRVGLAQALIHEPQVMILDEPSSGLDPNQIKEIRHLIKEISKDRTIILSTHILPEVEVTCDRVIIINKGTIATDGKIEELHQFMGKESIYHITLETPMNQLESELQTMQANGMISKFEVTLAKDNETSLKLFSSQKENLSKELFLWVKNKDYILTRLDRQSLNLEDLFANLTLKEGQS